MSYRGDYAGAHAIAGKRARDKNPIVHDAWTAAVIISSIVFPPLFFVVGAVYVISKLQQHKREANANHV